VNNLNNPGSLNLINLQLRSDWNPVLPGCVIFNSDTIKLTVIIGFIIDIVLLFTMLVGLFRLRNNGEGTFGMGLFLWKQVG
jgi:hypothetical protein